MAARKTRVQFDQKAIRNWTLYAIRLQGDHYYVGITSRKDFMRRIRQHGGKTGARINRGKVVEEIIEIQDLGKMTGLEAGRIENNTTLQYRKKFGYHKVRGGHDIFAYKYRGARFVPTYTPGSTQSLVFILCCLLLAALLLGLVTLYG
jgi:predicted GIY-YIG superfamily endonuclease